MAAAIGILHVTGEADYVETWEKSRKQLRGKAIIGGCP
jgi:hypothetical protein